MLFVGAPLRDHAAAGGITRPKKNRDTRSGRLYNKI